MVKNNGKTSLIFFINNNQFRTRHDPTDEGGGCL